MQSVTETEPKVAPSDLSAVFPNMKVRWRENIVFKKEGDVIARFLCEEKMQDTGDVKGCGLWIPIGMEKGNFHKKLTTNTETTMEMEHKKPEGAFSKSPLMTERTTLCDSLYNMSSKKNSKRSNKKMHGKCMEKSKCKAKDRLRRSEKKDEEILLNLMKKVSIEEKPKIEKRIKRLKTDKKAVSPKDSDLKKDKTAVNLKNTGLHSSMKKKKRKSTWKCVSFSNKTVSKHYVRAEKGSSTSSETSEKEECPLCGISIKDEGIEEDLGGDSMSRISKSRFSQFKTFKDLSKKELNTLKKNRENRANGKFINRLDAIIDAFYESDCKGQKRKILESCLENDKIVTDEKVMKNTDSKGRDEENLRKKPKNSTHFNQVADKNVNELTILDNEEVHSITEDFDSFKISVDDDDIKTNTIGTSSRFESHFKL